MDMVLPGAHRENVLAEYPDLGTDEDLGLFVVVFILKIMQTWIILN
jgi:hypothetical protein